MTPSAPIREAVALYLPWAALTPILGVWCFMLDGIFIGATRTVDMRNMMLVSFAVFLAACLALVPLIGNHGLWAALLVFYIVRALTLGLRYPALAAGVGARA
jgi:MATE family multidrug resistance protein